MGGGCVGVAFFTPNNKNGTKKLPASTAPSTFLWPLPPEHPGGE